MSLQRTPEPPPPEVFITEQLLRRPPKPADPLREKVALQDLASLIINYPEEVLPRFVSLAMELTGGVSAGLSLLEAEPAPGVFRWHYLVGSLSAFEGATTPRDYSPCGVTIDNNGPVLARHAEHFYSWIADAGIVVPEVLLVPLHLSGRDPIGTLWIVNDEEGAFDADDARVATELASFVGIAMRMQRDRRKLQQALDRQELLTREMSHRVKNLFALTDSMIRFGGRSATTPGELAATLSGRLHALSAAHELVLKDIGDRPDMSDLGSLIEAVTAPHQGMDGERFDIAGPVVSIGRQSTQSLALILHELATNAAKYGALSEESGLVTIRWAIEDGELSLVWAEQGGKSPSDAPAAFGFGSRLVDATIQGFGGTVERQWAAAGLSVTMTMPADRVAF